MIEKIVSQKNIIIALTRKLFLWQSNKLKSDQKIRPNNN